MEPNVVSNVTNVDNRTTVNNVDNSTNVNNVVSNLSNTTIIQQPKLSAAERAISIIRLQSSHRHFVGRERELENLRGWFLSGDWSHQQSCRVALLHGLGGMGKTELALRFANEWRSEFSFVYTIPAESAETRAGAYRQLATQLGVVLEEKSTPDQVRNRLFAHLEGATLEKPYLLFYDNVEEELTFPTRNGHLLVTARNQKFAPKDLEVHKFELAPMEEKEGLTLLKKWTGEEESPAMKELFHRLGGYPFVLAQAGAYIGSNPLRTVAKYVDKHTVPQKAEDRYQQTLDQVLGVTLGALKEEALLAFEWLQVCAYLNPDNIPLDYLERHLANEEERENVVLCLTNRSLMHFENGLFAMHRHIQEALRKMDAEGEALKKASSLIAGIEFDFDEFDSFEQLQNQSTVWASHAELLLECEIPPSDHAQLLDQMGTFQRIILCHHEKGLSYHQQALTMKKKVYGEEHPSVATSLNNIGVVLSDLGQYEEALEHYQQVLAIYKKVYGDQHPRVATSLNNIGNALCSLGRYEEALIRHRQALTIRRKVCGDQHSAVATSLNNIGGVLYALGRYQEALKHYNQALDVDKKIYGNQHPQVATFLSNIGKALDSLGHPKKALKHYQQALAIYKKVYGDQHPDVAMCLNSIGVVLDAFGRHEEALEHHHQALNIREKVYGDQHPDVAASLGNIGSTFDSLGRYDEAQKYQHQALAIYQKVYGNQHPDVATSLNNVGNTLYYLGRYDKALEYHRQALTIRKKLYGDRHPDVAASLSNIGSALDALSLYEEALEHHHQALAIRKKVCGDQHPDVAMSLNNIGNVLYVVGRYEEALKHYNRALTVQKKVYGDEHPSVAGFLTNSGNTLDDLGRHEEALKHHKQALGIRQKVYGDEHPSVASSLCSMGLLCQIMEDHEKAKECFQKAVTIGEKVLPSNHSRLKLYRSELAKIELSELKAKESLASSDKKSEEWCSLM